jgi:hypothetical protein
MAGGAELTGDGHVASFGARELDVTTLAEKEDRRVLTVGDRGWRRH